MRRNLGMLMSEMKESAVSNEREGWKDTGVMINSGGEKLNLYYFTEMPAVSPHNNATPKDLNT
jgi:hypothetical protein